MKKIVFRFWTLNFLIIISLFLIHGVVIAATMPIEGNFFEKVFSILGIFLNFWFSFFYFILMVISSFAFFLNCVSKIRSCFFLSLLTFCAIPLGCTFFIIIKLLNDINTYDSSVLRTPAIFSIIYLFFITFEFFLFRKRTIKIPSE